MILKLVMLDGQVVLAIRRNVPSLASMVESAKMESAYVKMNGVVMFVISKPALMNAIIMVNAIMEHVNAYQVSLEQIALLDMS